MNANRCIHYHSDCFQSLGVHCKLLTKQIEAADCPFYKTQEEVDSGRKQAHKKLKESGRFDLIEKYEYNKKRDW